MRGRLSRSVVSHVYVRKPPAIKVGGFFRLGAYGIHGSADGSLEGPQRKAHCPPGEQGACAGVLARVPGSRVWSSSRPRGLRGDLQSGEWQVSFLGGWCNGSMAVSKTVDRGSNPRPPGFSVACISTDRMRGYELRDGGSIPPMPASLTARGAVDSAVGSEPKGRWFESTRAEVSGPKLNRKSSGVLTRWIRVRITAGRFYGEGRSRVDFCPVKAAMRVRVPSLTPFNPVAKTERRPPAKRVMRRFDSGPGFHLASVAQRSALPPFKRRVVGSSPTGGTTLASGRKRLALEALLAKHRILTPGSGVRIPAGAPFYCRVVQW